MNTQNINVKTAASESSERWVEKLLPVWFTHKLKAITELAGIEGDLLMYRAYARFGIGKVCGFDELYAPGNAAGVVQRLLDMGAITSPAVYEMVSSVESLAMELGQDMWCDIHPEKLPPLATLQADAIKNRQQYQARIVESLKPFRVVVQGSKEFPEDDPAYGTYFSEGSISLGGAWSVSEAMDLVKSAWELSEWDPCEEGDDYYDSELGRDMGPVSFSPDTATITDESGRTVLKGDVPCLEWYTPVTDADEIARINADIDELSREAGIEIGWDNYETARQLRAKANHMRAVLVDEYWRSHPDVIAALNAFIHPERDGDKTTVI